MARPRKIGSADSGVMKDLITSIQGVLSDKQHSLPTKQAAGVMSVALESYGELGTNPESVSETLSDLESSLKEAQDATKDLIDSQDSSSEGSEGFVAGSYDALRDHQAEVATEAAAVMMMSYNKPAAHYPNGYAKPSFESDVRVNQFVQSGAAGNIAILPEGSVPSFESFDEKETEKWREHSYAINLLVAKQHEFAELFYKTYIVTPDQAGFQLSIRRNLVWEGWEGTGLSGAAVQFQKRNVLQGLLDYTVLETNSTELIPVIQKGENDAQFIDPTILAPETVVQKGENIDTNFIAFDNGGFNLLMLSQTPSRLKKGSPDFTDSLDSRIALKEILLVVKSGTATDTVALDVNRDQYAAYTATREYDFREMQLKFHTTLALTAETLNTDGTELASLKGLFDLGYTVVLGIKVDGEITVENGTGDTRLGSLKIIKVLKADGVTELALTDPTVSSLLADVTVTAPGYTLEARLTNYNQLERGLLIDSQVQKQGFMIPTLPPLCIVKPALNEEDKVYPKVEALVATYRLRMRNDAVTTLLNRADTLKSYLGVGIAHPIESNLGLEGVGQYYIKPYYNEATVDIVADLNNLTSSAKQTDIQGLLVSKINEMVYTADQQTGYTAALETCFPGRTPKPHVAIGTDMRLPQYLQIQGDDRTVGIGYDFTIARISDLRMKDKIVITFILPNVDEPHPLQHGVLGFIPEYMVNFQMIRNQRIAQEIRLTPRYRYFNFLPLMLVINVTNLEEAIGERTALSVNNLNGADAANS